MCDYSLQNVKSRKAQVEDKLTVCQFGMGTTGFRSRLETPDEQITAICLLPGTEVAFDKPIEYRSEERSLENGEYYGGVTFVQHTSVHSVAVFTQINKEHANKHHDAIELPNGVQVLLNDLKPNQFATVLQLPAVPNCPEEAEAQARVEFVG